MGKQSKIERANEHLKHVIGQQLTETLRFSSFLIRDSLSDEDIEARLRQARFSTGSKVAAYYELLANADQLGRHILLRHEPKILPRWGAECVTCVEGMYGDSEEWPCEELTNIFGFLECE